MRLISIGLGSAINAQDLADLVDENVAILVGTPDELRAIAPLLLVDGVSLVRTPPPRTAPANADADPVPELVRCNARHPDDRLPRARCSLITDGHGPEHKRITPTGRVTHRWPTSPLASEAPKTGGAQ